MHQMASAGHHHPGQQVELGTSFQEACQEPEAQKLGKRAPGHTVGQSPEFLIPPPEFFKLKLIWRYKADQLTKLSQNVNV